MAELTKEELVDHFADAVEEIEWYDEWEEQYPIVKTIIADEITDAQRKELEKLEKKKLVWTQHGTCERESMTAEFIEFEGNGCGCYASYAYHVSSKPHDGKNEAYSGLYTEVDVFCPVCNQNGEFENEDEDCPGPDLSILNLDKIDNTGCEDGVIRFYLT